ncbi:MAG TPA: Fe-S-containing protein [Thermoanaerobaculia bacterium]|nr:Fe-S-containing protein [Thermoanaerobaculia bacterium]
MPTFKPLHGVVIVATVMAAVILLNGRDDRPPRERVSSGRDGLVHLKMAELPMQQIRFYRYLSPANQEVEFFVGRDEQGAVQAAFDASENHFKLHRGYRYENGWVIDNKCGSSKRLNRVNEGGGGCSPIPLPFRTAGDEVLIANADLLQGWRLFR